MQNEKALTVKIKLKKKENQYAQVHVNMLRDRGLSLKAKGLGAVLESYSNDFEVSLRSIEIGSNDGIKSVRSAIKELEQGYFLFRFQTRDKGGLFSTYWAFDSQKLDVGYLHEIISELEKVELITPEQLLQRGIPYGNAVTGMPSTASRSTASRQRTTYNNINYQNIEDNNNSLYRGKERDIFKNLQSFKSHFITKNTNVPFCTQGIGFETSTPFKINESGYIVNMVNSKIIAKEEALKIWEYLFNFYKTQKESTA